MKLTPPRALRSMTIAAVPLLLAALVAQVFAIVRYCRFQEELRRRVDAKPAIPQRGQSFDDMHKAPVGDRKWTEFVDEEDR